MKANFTNLALNEQGGCMLEMMRKRTFRGMRSLYLYCCALLFAFCTLVPATLRGQSTVTIGTASTTYSYFPNYNWYEYSITQQVYTASEILAAGGGAGQITSLAFNCYSVGSSSSRYIQIFMKNSPRTSFTTYSSMGTGSGGWESDLGTLVYSGYMYPSTGWNTFNFSTPFTWDGSSNIIITVDDNTGSYSSENSWYVYSTSSYQSIYAYNDSYNLYLGSSSGSYSPTSYGSRSYSTGYKNQIRMTMSSGGGGGGTECNDIQIGTLSSTSYYIPSYSYYCYALAEQIYLSSELGSTAGQISSVSLYNGGSTKTRSYTIYMVATNKSYFSGSYDWITPTSSNQVYTGTVSMTAGAWTTFNFDTPFEYDGSSNVVLIMDDNTGSWSSGMACYVTSQGSYRTLYVYSDSPNYNALSPTSYSGSRSYDRNTVKFHFCPQSGPAESPCAMWGGSGTSADPYTISNEAGLVCLRDAVNSGTNFSGTYFKLTSNISLTSAFNTGSNVPIGVSSSYPFKGRFDGNNKTISNLNVNYTGTYHALFGYTMNATIENLTVSGYVQGSSYRAGIVAYANNTTIENCTNNVTFNTTSDSYYRGGIVGYATGGSISDCINNSDITGSYAIAGIAGSVTSCNITDCSNYGDITTSSYNAAGIVGRLMTSSTISGCVNEGDIVTTSSYSSTSTQYGIGGIVGYSNYGSATSSYTISDCHNRGNIQTLCYLTGGIVGYHYYYGYIGDCTNSGNITTTGSPNYVGGIAGYNYGYNSTYRTHIDYCTNTGNVSGYQYVGGIAGQNEGYSSGSSSYCSYVEGCTNSGAVTGYSSVGGIIGQAYYTVAEFNENSGSVTSTSSYAGGIAGYTYYCYYVDYNVNRGNVSGGSSYTGGILGYCYYNYYTRYNENYGDVTGAGVYTGGINGSAYSTSNYYCQFNQNSGDVTSSSYYVGGINGYDYYYYTDYCVNTGRIHSSYSGQAYVGGITGYNSSYGYTRYCLNAGKVSGYSYVGGLVGYQNSYSYFQYNLNVGAVEGVTSTNIGALMGYASGFYTSCPSYWDKQMCTIGRAYGSSAGTSSSYGKLTRELIGTYLPTSSYFVSGTNLYPRPSVQYSTDIAYVAATPILMPDDEDVDNAQTCFTAYNTYLSDNWTSANSSLVSVTGTNGSVVGTGDTYLTATRYNVSKEVDLSCDGNNTNCFVATYPEDGATAVEYSPMLEWEPILCANQYYIYVGTTNNFASATLQGTTYNTYYYMSSLSPATTYYWWVLPMQSNTTACLPARFSTTCSTPPSFTVTAPASACNEEVEITVSNVYNVTEWSYSEGITERGGHLYVRPGATTTYTVYGANANCAPAGQSVTINVDGPDAQIVSSEGNTCIDAGDEVTIEAIAAGGIPTSYTGSLNMYAGTTTRQLAGGSMYHFYDNGGSSGSYSNSANYYYTFQAPVGSHVTLTFHSGNFESCCDYVSVYDGPSTSSLQLGTSSGYSSWNNDGIPFVSTGNTLTVYFYSDGSVTSSGWDATVYCPESFSYAWSTGSTEATTTVSPSETTNYTVTVTGGNSYTCPSILTHKVKVNPTIEVAPENPRVCPGGTVALTAQGADNYVWTDSYGTTLSTQNPYTVYAGTYNVSGTTIDGCSASTSVTVSSLSSPSAGTIVSSEVCQSDYEITIESGTAAIGGGNVEYQWHIGSITTGWSTEPSYTLTSSDRNTLGTGTFTVTRSFRDACSNSGSTNGTLTINPPMTAPSVSGVTSLVCGQSTTLTASSIYDSNPNLQYRWYSDPQGQNLVYEGTEFTTPSLTENTTYYLQISDGHIEMGTPQNYSSYGAYTYSIPMDATQLKLEVWGAQGGTYSSYTGGLGGYSVGTLTNLTDIDNLYVYVGGAGTTNTTGGYNGGGAGVNSGRGGGGATDIRTEQNNLLSRIIVAGGGGGAGVSYGSTYPAGCGGGIYGGDGYYNYTNGSYITGNYRSGGGATPTQGGISWNSISSTQGTFGFGGNAYNYSCGGGGGGWYGGGGAYDNDSDSDGRYGGGGSGYVWTSATSSDVPSGYAVSADYYLSNAQTIAGNTSFTSPNGGTETGHTGNGYARITPYVYVMDNCPSEMLAVNIIVNQMAAPDVQVVSACTGTPSEMVVTNPVPGYEYQWSTDPSFSTIAYTGITFTPTVYTSTQYYVRAVQDMGEPVADFSYTGAEQVYTVPARVSQVRLEVWGAQGGTGESHGTSAGGYSVGTLNVTPGQTLYVYVGGQGTYMTYGGTTHSTSVTTPGGWNGGGSVVSSAASHGSGGGGTDIRVGGNSLYNRIIVAGGGGGIGNWNEGDSYGGGTNGIGSYSGYATYAGSGYSGTNGAFGQGGNGQGDSGGGAGAGGGWYGGGGQGVTYYPGGAGSGYVWTSATASNAPAGYLVSASNYLTDAQTIAGNSSFPAPAGGTEVGHSGNGFARITLLDYSSNHCPSEVSTITLTPGATPSFNLTASSRSYCQGDQDVHLSVINPSANVTSYAWSTGETTSSIDVTPGHTMTYFVTVSTETCSVKDSLQISVDAPDVQIVASVDGCIDAGDEVTLSCGGQSGQCPSSVNMSNTPMTLSAGCSFSYYDHNGPSSSYSNYESYIQTFTSSNGGPITIRLSSADGESCCDYLRLYDGTTTSSSLLCSSTLYYWSTYTTYTATSGSLTVYFTSDGSGVGSGWVAEITAVDPNTYVWSNGSTESSITVTPSETTTYTVTVSDNSHSCSAILDYTVKVTPTITVTPENPMVCPGATVDLTASGADSYVWTNSSTAVVSVQNTYTASAGTYNVTGTTDEGCSASTSVTVSSLSTPSAGTIVSSEVCQSDYEITIESGTAAIGGGNVEYQWTIGSVTTGWSTEPSYTLTSSDRTALGTGTFSVVRSFRDACSNSGSANGTLTINPPMEAPSVAGNTNVLCGQSTTLTASSSLTSPNLRYRWYSDPQGQNLVYVGSEFTTPAMMENTTYYLQITNELDENRVTNFSYTGAPVSYTIPEGTDSLTLEVWGAQGGGQQNSGNTYAGVGGKGGYSVGTMPVNGGENISVYVGGQGGYAGAGLAVGGWNGGGSNYGSSSSEPAGGGGGATDIRVNGSTLYHRIIVAGGGGGGGEDSGDVVGAGGGTSGTAGGSRSDYGTQTSGTGGAVFGIGASAPNDGGAGGGGWYGGGTDGGSQSIPTYGSGTDCQGGSGGSGFVWTSATSGNVPSGYLVSSNYYLINAQTIAGTQYFPAVGGGQELGHGGNGYARITAHLHSLGGCPSEMVAVNITVNQLSAPIVEVRSACAGTPSEMVVTNPVPGYDYQWSTEQSFSTFEYTGTTYTPTVNTSTQYYVRAVQASGEEITEFSYTGSSVNYTVPTGVSSIQVELWGANGGDQTYYSGTYDGGQGGRGGYTTGEVNVSAGDVLQVNVGGAGSNSMATGYSTNPGGWNGGGAGGYGYSYFTSASGGGASDIRMNGTSLYDRVLVAGGGGGSGYYSGGDAGGTSGSSTSSYSYRSGLGATLSAGGSGGYSGCDGYSGTQGSLGQGGNGASASAGGGGGGGGYYGGGGGADGCASSGGGGGGSGYVAAGISGNTMSYLSAPANPDQNGNGFVRITLLDYVSGVCPSEVASVTLTPGETPSFNLTASSRSYCQGDDDVRLTVANPSPNVNSYTWSTGETTQYVDVTPGHTMTYFVTVSTGTCGVKDSVQIYVDAPEVQIVASSESCIAPGDEVTLNLVGATMGGEIIVGSNTTTSYLAPTNSCYNYSKSETIYTAAEIGQAGYITSISYYVTTWAQNRTGTTVYMRNTSKNYFTSSYDFVAMSSADIVASGITFPSSSSTGWQTITLSSPFYYDGTSNLLVAFDVPYLRYSCTNEFAAYTASSYRVIGGYSDSYSYPATSTNYEYSDYSTSVPCVKFNMIASSDMVWSTGSTESSITVTPSETTTYTVTVSDNSHACAAIMDYTVKVNPTIVIASEPESLCQSSDPAVLTASGASAYLWNNGTIGAVNSVVGEGTYTVSATNADGCSSVASYSLVAPVFNAGSINGNMLSICQSETNPLHIASVDDGTTGGNIHYRWYRNGNLIPDSDSAAYEITPEELVSVTPGTYRYTREVQNGCTSTWTASAGTYSVTIMAPFAEPTVHGNENYVVCGTDGKLYVAHDDEVMNYWYEDAECTQLYAVGDTVTVPSMFESKTLWHVAMNQTFAPIAQEYGVVGQHQYTVPAGVTELQLEVWGAQGGSYNSSYPGGKGGYSAGTLPVNEGDVLNIYVGGQPTSTTGGYNGGGAGKTFSYSYTTYSRGGGGATDIRVNGTSLYQRVIVAGGGSGSNNRYSGYAAGGATSQGYSSSYVATQSSAGLNASFGTGASATGSYNYNYGPAGGGGGWYGGGSSSSSSDGDSYYASYMGGGSGYVNTETSYHPAGYYYTDSYFLSNETLAGGTETFLSPAGIQETGHSGNGYARIIGNSIVNISPCPSIPVAYTLQVQAPTAPAVEAEVNTYCGLPVTLEVQDYNSELTYQWSSQPDFSDTLAWGQYYSVTPTAGSYNYYVKSYIQDVLDTTADFDYTGSPTTFMVPAGVTELQVEVWGAQGGSYNSSYQGGKGGYSAGTLSVNAGDALSIYVGGQPAYSSSTSGNPGGYNGGGAAKLFSYNSVYTYSQGGGGATDIRVNGTSLYQRVIVAGGGSGSNNRYSGYAAGGSTSQGYSSSYVATQSSAGLNASFGTGASATGSYNYKYGPAGGGGGWYGGGSSSSSSDSYSYYASYMGGGSGYVNTETSYHPAGYYYTDSYFLRNETLAGGTETFLSPSGVTETGHSGNGYARITYAVPGERHCESPTASIQLVVADAPAITFVDEAPVTVCGEDVTLQVASPVQGYTYEWFSNPDCTLSLGTGVSLLATNVIEPTNYYVKSYANLGTTLMCVSDPSSVTVNLLPIEDPTIAVPSQITCGVPLTLTVSNPMQGFNYVWFSDPTCLNLVNTGTVFDLAGVQNIENRTYYVKACKEAVGSARQDTTDFEYDEGAVYSYSIPQGVARVNFQVWGAQGGSYNGARGGLGGYAEGSLSDFSNVNTISVYVGGQNGYNGGASSNYGAGGGATDIRINGETLNDRFLVAGGGGGAGSVNGGYGGGLQAGSGANGYNGGGDLVPGGIGAAQSGSMFGVNTTFANRGGGGGAGWYAGSNGDNGSSSGTRPGGGGGSGYVSSMLQNARTVAGNNEFPAVYEGTETGHNGNGFARIIAQYPVVYTCESSLVPVVINLNPIADVSDAYGDFEQICEGEVAQLYAATDMAEDDPEQEQPQVVWYRGSAAGNDSVFVGTSLSSDMFTYTENVGGEWFYYAYAATDLISSAGDYDLSSTAIYENLRGSISVDVHTPVDMKVHGFSVYPSSSVTNTTVRVWYTTTSGEGHYRDASVWTSLGEYEIAADGNNAVPFELNDSVAIPAGATYAFYFQALNNGLYYANNGLDRIAYDAITGVELFKGNGESGFNFPANSLSERQFCGAVHYSLTGETRYGCMSQNGVEIYLYVNAPSDAPDTIFIADGRDTICVGDEPVTLSTRTLSLGDNAEFVWLESTETGFEEFESGSESVDVTPSVTTTYGVYLRSEYCGNTDTIYTTITVAQRPVVSAIQPDTICALGGLNIDIPHIEFGNLPDYANSRWECSVDGENFVRFTAAENQQIGTGYNGWYIRYAAASVCNMGYSDTVQIVVDSAAYFDVLQNPDAICAGTLFDWRGNSATPHYVNNSQRPVRTGWNLFTDGQLVDFDESYAFTYHSDPDYYQYNCYIVTGCDSVVSNLATITVWDRPEVDPIVGIGATCAGQPVTLTPPTVTPRSPIDTVGWEYADAIGSQYFHRLPADFVIDYSMNGKVLRYFAEGPCGHTESNAVQISIIDRPYMADIASLDTVCSNTPFEMEEPEITDDGGTEEYTTGWYLSNDSIVGDNEAVTQVYVGDSMNYYVWNNRWLHFGVTNACGTRYSNGVKAFIRPDHNLHVEINRMPYGGNPDIELVENAESCFGPDYQFIARSDYAFAGCTYSWTATEGAHLASTTGSTVLSQRPDAGFQRYIVDVVENEFGCSASDTVLFYVSLIHLDTTVTVCQSDLPYCYDPIEKPNDLAPQSGDYQIVYQTEGGCDSVINLHLNVHYPIVNRSTLHVCNNEPEFEWRGMRFGGMGVEDQQITSADTIKSRVWFSDLDWQWDPTQGAFVHTEGCDSIIYVLELSISDEPYLSIPQDEFTLPVGESVTAEANFRKDCEVCSAKAAIIYQLYKDGVPVDTLYPYGDMSIQTYLPTTEVPFGTALTTGHGEIPGTTFAINNYDYNYFYAQFFGEINNYVTATWRQPGEYKLQMVILRTATQSGFNLPINYRYEDFSIFGQNGYNWTMMGGANGVSTDSVFTDTAYIYFHVGSVTDVVIDTAVCANGFPFDYQATTITGPGSYEIAVGSEGQFNRYFLNVTSTPIDTTILSVNTTGSYYEYHGGYYGSEQVHTVRLQASTGCDSIVLLTVHTFAANNNDTIHAVACHDYVWNRQTYDATGVYANDNHYLDLVILDGPYAERTIRISEWQLPYVYENEVYEDFGTYRIAYPTGGECDSLVDLHLVEATPLIDIDTTTFAYELNEQNVFTLTVLNDGVNVPKLALDYVITRNGVVLDNVGQFGSVYFSTPVASLHRSFGANLTSGVGEIPGNTFNILYYNYDYFYNTFFNGISNDFTATWNIPGEYKIKFFLRERQGGQDYPLTMNNLVIGGHGSSAGSLIAMDSVVMHYVGDTIRLDYDDAICSNQISDTLAYNFHGFEFTETDGGLNMLNTYTGTTTFVPYISYDPRRIDTTELFIFDPFRVHDTIVNYTLTIHPAYYITYTANVCDGAPYTDANFNLSAAQIRAAKVNDTSVFVLRAVTEMGCDSIVTLKLNVVPNPVVRIGVISPLVCEGGELPFTVTVNSRINYNNVSDVNFVPDSVTRDTVNGVEKITYYKTEYSISSSWMISVASANTIDNTVCAVSDSIQMIVLRGDTMARKTASVCQGNSYFECEPTWLDCFDISAETTQAAIDPEAAVPVIIYDTIMTGTTSCGHYYMELALTVFPRYDSHHPLVITDDVCEGYPYNDHGFDLSADSILNARRQGVAYFRHENISSLDCDSVTILQLTVIPTVYGQKTVPVCESALPYEYTFEGTRVIITRDTIVNFLMAGRAATGCDSVVITHFAIEPMPVFTVAGETTICDNGSIDLAIVAPASDSVKWLVNGSVYSTTPMLQATAPDLMSQATAVVHLGTCTATREVNITINPTYTVYDTTEICDNELPYTWNNVEFTAAGTQPATLSSALGCDSTVVMTLVVNPTYQIVVDTNILAADLPFTYNNRVFEYGVAAHSTTVFNLTTVNGCDSVVTLNLYVDYGTAAPFMEVDSVSPSEAILTVYGNDMPFGSKVAVRYTLYKDNQLVQDFDNECGGDLFIGTEFQGIVHGQSLTTAVDLIPRATFTLMNYHYDYFYLGFLNARTNVVSHQFTQPGTYKVVFELINEAGGIDFPYMYDGVNRIGGKNSLDSIEVFACTPVEVTFVVTGGPEGPTDPVLNAPEIILSQDVVEDASSAVLLTVAEGDYLGSQVSINYSIYREGETEPMSMLANVANIQFGTMFNGQLCGNTLQSATGSIPFNTFRPMQSYEYNYFNMEFLANTSNMVEADWYVPGNYSIVFNLMEMTNGQDFGLVDSQTGYRVGGKIATPVRSLAKDTLTYHITTVANPMPMGLEDNVESNETIALYPNPTNTRTTLSLGKVEANTLVQITDANGKEVYRVIATESTMELNVATWAEGVYFVNVRNANQSVNKKLVVTK